MRKLLNNKLFLCLALFLAFISGVIASNYLASDVAYTPSDSNWDVNNVADALDDIYGRSFNFEELYTLNPGLPANFSYTFTDTVKDVIVAISTIRDVTAGEADFTISLPENAINIYECWTSEAFGKGKTGDSHTKVYYIHNATGTISGTVSYRGKITILKIK